MNRKQYKAKRLHDKALSLSVELLNTLGKLSREASEIVGVDLNADICEGAEIEFRREGEESETYMRIEDVVNYNIKDEYL